MEISPLFAVAVCAVLLHAIGSSSDGIQKSSEQLLFESFTSNYSKKYRNDQREMSFRFEIFQQTLARINVLNDLEKLSGGTAVFGVNKFSDLTPEEFKQLHLSPQRKVSNSSGLNSNSHYSELNGTRFDWRDQGVIGPIRDQSKCGSCWAFAVVETIASAYAIQRKQKLQHILSSQQLISCDLNPNKGLDGCRGGVLQQAFQTLKDMGLVLVDDSVYPFKSKNGEDYPCLGSVPDKGVMLTNFSYSEKVELLSMAQLLKTSPLTTSVNAIPWQDYIGGIVQHHCTATFVDHAVQIVGYDLTGEVPYWIIRNTWGSNWGEQGYIRIMFSDDNLCGLQNEVAAVWGTVGVNL